MHPINQFRYLTLTHYIFTINGVGKSTSGLLAGDKVGSRPVERGEVFPGPATFWGPHYRSKILKKVFQMASF